MLQRKFFIKGLSEPSIQTYHRDQVKMAMAFGTERTRAEIEMREVIDFEIELAKVRFY